MCCKYFIRVKRSKTVSACWVTGRSPRRIGPVVKPSVKSLSLRQYGYNRPNSTEYETQTGSHVKKLLTQRQFRKTEEATPWVWLLWPWLYILFRCAITVANGIGLVLSFIDNWQTSKGVSNECRSFTNQYSILHYTTMTVLRPKPFVAITCKA